MTCALSGTSMALQTSRLMILGSPAAALKRDPSASRLGAKDAWYAAQQTGLRALNGPSERAPGGIPVGTLAEPCPS